jgi:hypothetical protein
MGILQIADPSLPQGPGNITLQGKVARFFTYFREHTQCWYKRGFKTGKDK